MTKENGNKLLKGAAILGIASIIVKAIGAVFRLPLTNWIGDVGMSYYGVAYTVYSVLLVLAISGMPVAISRMVSERIALGQYKNAHRVFTIAVKMMFFIGLASFSICYFGGNIIANLMGNPESASALKAIAPALLFVPILASFRGYFQGRQNMNPTAISEVMEQLVRATVGLSLAYIFIPKGEATAAAGAAFGASIGSFSGLIILALIYLANRKVFRYKIEKNSQVVESHLDIIKKIIYIAVPIVIGAEVMPIMGLIDTSIIMNRLQATGWSLVEAKGMYGLFSGFVNPIISLPQIFTVAVSVSLVPAIAACVGIGDKKGLEHNVQLSLRTTMIMVAPCGIGIFALAKPILLLLYAAQAESAIQAVPIMQVMAIAILLLAVVQTLTGILQAIGKQTLPVRNLIIASILKLVVSFILIGIPSINVVGAALGTLIAYGITLILNLVDVIKYTGVKVDLILTYVKPLIAAIIMGVIAFGSHFLLIGFIGNAMATLMAIVLGGITYVVLIFMLKAINLDEINTIPSLRKFGKILGKFGIK